MHLEEAYGMEQTQIPNFFSIGTQNNVYDQDKCVSYWLLLEGVLDTLDVAYITHLILQSFAKNKFVANLYPNTILDTTLLNKQTFISIQL